MTTQRTLRIDDEMLNRARAAFLDLEAALSPYLERRQADRREGVRLAMPIDIRGHEPDCLAAEMIINPKPGKMYLCTCKKKPWFIAPSKPSKDQIHVSEGMTQAGLWAFYKDISGEIWRSRERHQEMAMAYRAMRLKEIEEQQNPDMGSR